MQWIAFLCMLQLMCTFTNVQLSFGPFPLKSYVEDATTTTPPNRHRTKKKIFKENREFCMKRRRSKNRLSKYNHSYIEILFPNLSKIKKAQFAQIELYFKFFLKYQN